MERLLPYTTFALPGLENTGATVTTFFRFAARVSTGRAYINVYILGIHLQLRTSSPKASGSHSMICRFLLLLGCFSALSSVAQTTITTDVLVIGGGTGGTAAGIQSARSGAKTLVAESTTWLGGMISAAGV